MGSTLNEHLVRVKNKFQYKFSSPTENDLAKIQEAAITEIYNIRNKIKTDPKYIKRYKLVIKNQIDECLKVYFAVQNILKGVESAFTEQQKIKSSDFLNDPGNKTFKEKIEMVDDHLTSEYYNEIVSILGELFLLVIDYYPKLEKEYEPYFKKFLPKTQFKNLQSSISGKNQKSNIEIIPNESIENLEKSLSKNEFNLKSYCYFWSMMVEFGGKRQMIPSNMDEIVKNEFKISNSATQLYNNYRNLTTKSERQVSAKKHETLTIYYDQAIEIMKWYNVTPEIIKKAEDEKEEALIKMKQKQKK